MGELLTTKRQTLAQVSICNGCCCGRTEKGRPGIPLDFLKRAWKSRGLLKTIQLTISGCLGPCDIPNVIAIATPTGTEWLGNVTRDAEYEALLDWAERCAGEERLLPLPSEFAAKRIRRWRE